MSANKKKAGLTIGGLALAIPLVFGALESLENRFDSRYVSVAHASQLEIRLTAAENSLECQRILDLWYKTVDTIFFLSGQLEKHSSNETLKRKLYEAEQQKELLEQNMVKVYNCSKPF